MKRGLSLYALVFAYGISQWGTAMSALAIPWLVLTTTGSAARTGLVGFAELAPYVAVQATAGPLVDRLGARRGCVLGNAAAAVAVCAVPALYAVGALRLAVLVALVAIAGGVRGVADAGTGPLVPGTARLGDVPSERAAGLYSGAGRIGLLLGMPLAGVVIGISSAATAVLVDGVSFAVAAIMIAALVPRAAQPQVERDRLNYLARLGEGLRFLRGDRLLLGIVMTIALTNLLEQALISVLMPVWVRDRLHDPTALGFIGGVLNIGALLGVLLVTWLGPRLPRRGVCAAGMVLSGAPLFGALALWHTLPPVLAVAGISGLAAGGINPIIGAIQYERVPARLQARVLSAVKASAWIGLPFGSLLGGALAAGAGLTAGLVVTGGCLLLVTLAPFVFPAWRGMNRAVTAQPA
jgi:MFS family permease